MSLRNLKNKYDRKVLETFDLIGCYFIDLFYNDLFLKSKHAFTTGHSKSLTETYRSHIIWFMRGIDEKPKNYIEVMKKLLDYYNSATKTITSTLSELEHKILCQFIPTEYYQDFTNANKEKVLHDIIIRAVNQLGEIALEPVMLGKIIDDHMNQGNVQLLQEKMTDIFIILREEYYSKFVNEISKASGNKTVSIEQFKKLKSEYAEEIKRRIGIESERDRAVQLLQVSLKKIAELESQLDSTSHSGTVNAPTRTLNTVKSPIGAVKSPISGAVKSPMNAAKSPVRLVSPQVHVKQTSAKKSQKKKVDYEDTTHATNDVNDNTYDTYEVNDTTHNTRGNTHNDTTDEVNDENANSATYTDEATNDDNIGLKLSDLNIGSSSKLQREEDSSDGSSESDSEDSEELHARQRKALMEKRQSELSLGLEDDDPGFGN
jgi:hypothetical protein